MNDDDSIRLNKFLALSLGSSRREADDMISEGRVTINDATAQLGARVLPGADVKVDDTPIQSSTDLLYVAFNKPAGYVCSRKPQGDNPTIYEIIPETMFALIVPA